MEFLFAPTVPSEPRPQNTAGTTSSLRHPKRYQDVEEILDAGINIYTTVNIQH